jgi:hypothetical protein
MMSVTGRDIPENEYATVLTGEGVWKLDGGSLGTAAEAAHERQEKGNLDARAFSILTFVNGSDETRPDDLAVLGIDAKRAAVYLGRLATSGRIRKIKRGVYGPATAAAGGKADVLGLGLESVESVESVETNNTYNAYNSAPLIGDTSQSHPRCKHCNDELLLDDSRRRGYCAKPKCLLAKGEH